MRKIALIALLGLIVVAAPAAAPAPDPAALRAKLGYAIADEERALALLRKAQRAIDRADGDTTRGTEDVRSADGELERSLERLREIRSSRALPGGAGDALEEAIRTDTLARRRITPYPVADISGAVLEVEEALQHKSVAMTLLEQPATARGAQCGDRIDNDGDGTIDARHDSGCASARDGTEGSALTCSLGYTAGAPVAVVRGTCSGPFATLELTAPAGAVFDTGAMPTVQHAQACRYQTERKLECVMNDGLANPRHVVSARFKLKKVSSAGLRALITDFRGHGRAQVVAPSQGGTPAPSLRFKLSYTHDGPSHVCASIEATSGAFLELSLEGPNGQTASGTLQLKKKEQTTAPGGFSFRILALGRYKVTITATVGGKSVTRTQTIDVTEARGDSRCSATGAPPP